jgi:hypothetical protein
MIAIENLKTILFLLSIYDSNESIDFVHGKSKTFFPFNLDTSPFSG